MGGIAGDLLGFAEGRKERLPEYYRKVRYYAGAFILAGVGGVVTTLYGGPMNAILAFHLGASAPLIVKSATSSIPRGTKID